MLGSVEMHLLFKLAGKYVGKEKNKNVGVHVEMVHDVHFQSGIKCSCREGL